MCYNKEVSFVIALFGIFCAIKEFKNNNKLSAIIILTLVLMQINEFFLHVYNNPNTWSHQISAFMIPITISIQVLMMLVFSFILNINKYTKMLLIASTLLFLFLMFIATVFILYPVLMNKGFNSTLLCPVDCRLKWDSYDIIGEKSPLLLNVLIICYLISIIIVTTAVYGKRMLSLIIFLIGLSYLLSLYGNQENYNRIASMWCLMSIIVSCLVIIIK